jgi:hypothetical protein
MWMTAWRQGFLIARSLNASDNPCISRSDLQVHMRLIGAGLVAFLLLYFVDHHFANGRYTSVATSIVKRLF